MRLFLFRWRRQHRGTGERPHRDQVLQLVSPKTSISTHPQAPMDGLAQRSGRTWAHGVYGSMESGVEMLITQKHIPHTCAFLA